MKFSQLSSYKQRRILSSALYMGSAAFVLIYLGSSFSKSYGAAHALSVFGVSLVIFLFDIHDIVFPSIFRGLSTLWNSKAVKPGSYLPRIAPNSDGLGQYIARDRSIVPHGSVYETLHTGAEIYVPNAGSESYQEFFRKAGFVGARVISITPGTHNRIIGVTDGSPGNWFVATQRAHRTKPGFIYSVNFNNSFDTYLSAAKAAH